MTYISQSRVVNLDIAQPAILQLMFSYTKESHKHIDYIKHKYQEYLLVKAREQKYSKSDNYSKVAIAVTAFLFGLFTYPIIYELSAWITR